MAIGKTKVNAMNFKRVQLEKTASGEELAVCRFNGSQRDAYMSLMFALRDRFKKDGMAPEGLKDIKVETLTTEQAALFTEMEYKLIQLSVVDGDALAQDRLEPLFDSPDEVATQLEPAVVSEWAAICNRVHGLGEEEERTVAADFTPTPNAASGLPSPGCVEGQTSPG